MSITAVGGDREKWGAQKPWQGDMSFPGLWWRLFGETTEGVEPPINYVALHMLLYNHKRGRQHLQSSILEGEASGNETVAKGDGEHVNELSPGDCSPVLVFPAAEWYI